MTMSQTDQAPAPEKFYSIRFENSGRVSMIKEEFQRFANLLSHSDLILVPDYDAIEKDTLQEDVQILEETWKSDLAQGRIGPEKMGNNPFVNVFILLCSLVKNYPTHGPMLIASIVAIVTSIFFCFLFIASPQVGSPLVTENLTRTLLEIENLTTIFFDSYSFNSTLIELCLNSSFK
jgi:hypothetical protein